MIVPKGELLGIFRGKPQEFFNKVDNGYLKISWKDVDDICSACVVFKDGIAVFADLEFVKSKKILKGKDALKRILSVSHGVIEVYKLNEKQISLVALINSEDIAVNQQETTVVEKLDGKTEQPEEEEFKEVENLEDFIYNLEEDFTGIIIARGEDREATLYIKDGMIIGARVKFNNNEYLGLSALYYLDFKGNITCEKLSNIERYVSDELKISNILLDRNEILRKYNIVPPDEKTVENLLKILDELYTPVEKWKIFRKLMKIFKIKRN
jgi:hypothetical protein